MGQNSPQTNGALARNKKVRESSVKSYYANPNICAFCNKIIEIGENDIPSQIRLKKYCNHSCYSAHKIGRKYQRRQLDFKVNSCKNCNENFNVKKRTIDRFEQKRFCETCRYLSKSSLYKTTKLALFAKNKNWQSARNSVRKHACSVFRKSQMPLICFICEYDCHVEIAHIKAVSQFSDDSLIIKINHISNLVALCPNHHWEFDNGKFSIINRNSQSSSAKNVGESEI